MVGAAARGGDGQLWIKGGMGYSRFKEHLVSCWSGRKVIWTKLGCLRGQLTVGCAGTVTPHGSVVPRCVFPGLVD